MKVWNKDQTVPGSNCVGEIYFSPETNTPAERSLFLAKAYKNGVAIGIQDRRDNTWYGLIFEGPEFMQLIAEMIKFKIESVDNDGDK